MSPAARPAHQWFLGGLVALLLLEPLSAWVIQLVELLGECVNGLSNAGLDGALHAGYCSLYDGHRPLLRIPWTQDALITAMLVLVLVFVAASLLVPRWSRWSPRLVLTAVPLLMFAVLSMGGRGYQRMEGEVFDYVLRRPFLPGRGGFLRVHDGWVINLPVRSVWIPDIGGLPLGLSFFAGLALLVLTSALLADHIRGQSIGQFHAKP